MRLYFWLLISIWLSAATILPFTSQAGEATYLYDDLGRLSQVIDETGEVATYTYDAVGNVLSITRSTGGVPAPTITALMPTSGAAGTTVAVTIDGQSLQGAGVTTDNPGIVVSQVQTSPAHITASCDIACTATSGASTVTVTTSLGTAATTVLEAPRPS